MLKAGVSFHQFQRLGGGGSADLGDNQRMTGTRGVRNEQNGKGERQLVPGALE